METKICSKCGIEKSIMDFSFRSDTQKYNNICKECKSEYARNYHKKNIEIIKEKSKKYRTENAEKIKKQIQDSYKRNRDKILEKNKEYYKENAEHIKSRQKNYNEKNKEKILMRQRDYYKNHIEERINWQKEYYLEHKEDKQLYDKKYRKENIDKLNEYRKQYYENNKERLNAISKEYSHTDKMRIWRREHKKERKEKDPLYKLSEQTRTLINNCFRRQGYKKNSKTAKILGCDFKTFYDYLLKTYKENYSEDWDGKEDVHIDHIIPISMAKSEEEIIKLCHYTNLQLLKAKDNFEKSDKLDWKLEDE